MLELQKSSKRESDRTNTIVDITIPETHLKEAKSSGSVEERSDLKAVSEMDEAGDGWGDDKSVRFVTTEELDSVKKLSLIHI